MEERKIYPIPSDGSVPLPEASRVMRDARPAHYTLKIESFSQLSKVLATLNETKHESPEFEVGGYKWRLSLYPTGDEKRNGADHISLYLVLSDRNNIPNHLEVNAFFKLFIYDHIRDKYLTVQDASKKEQRFHALKTECGFAQFLPLTIFNDVANGYLVDDCCIFGAEVIVTNCTGIGESLSIKKPIISTFTFKWDKFSKLDKKVYKSSEFTAGGWKWFLKIYPKGFGEEEEKGLGLFLELADGFNLIPGEKVYVEYKLQVKNQLGKQHAGCKLSKAFDGTEYWGLPKILVKSDLKDTSKGFIVNDILVVECEFILAVEVKTFS